MPFILNCSILKSLSLVVCWLWVELFMEEEDWEEEVGEVGVSLSVVVCKSVECGGLAVWSGESGSKVGVEVNVRERLLSFGSVRFGESGSVVVEEVEVEERLLLFESESWSRWRGQVKVGVYSLSRMPEHLRWIQCFDLVLH